MNAREIYDAIIADIESGAKDRNKPIDVIMYSLESAYAIPIRELSSLIRFMTGETLLNYIKQRKMMLAYQELIESKTCKDGINSAIEISGYDNQSSFTKKFSELFHIPPKEAFQKKDETRFSLPLTWNVVSCNFDAMKVNGDNMKIDKPQTIFGVSKEQYDKIIEVHTLEEIYSFEPMFSKVAFELSEQLGRPLKDTFRFADSLRSYGGDFSGADDDPEEPTLSLRDPETNLREVAFDPCIQFMFFNCNLSVGRGIEMLDIIGVNEKELINLDPEMIFYYSYLTNKAELDAEEEFDTEIEFETGIEFDYSYFKRAYDYYHLHKTDRFSEDDFKNYINLLINNVPIQVAFNAIIPSGTEWNRLSASEQDRIDNAWDYIEEMNDLKANERCIIWDEENPYYDDY